jgi:hypothetical protein
MLANFYHLTKESYETSYLFRLHVFTLPECLLLAFLDQFSTTEVEDPWGQHSLLKDWPVR